MLGVIVIRPFGPYLFQELVLGMWAHQPMEIPYRVS